MLPTWKDADIHVLSLTHTYDTIKYKKIHIMMSFQITGNQERLKIVFHYSLYIQ